MYFKNKRCLVTGSGGLVGTNLIAQLQTLKADVLATYHVEKPNLSNIINVDLTRPEDCLNATKDIDIVFHCAANTSGAAAIQNTPLAHVTPNICMNANLLEASFKNKVQKFVWLSSTTGYPQLDRPVKEEDMFVGEPYEKYFAVGWMKRYTEKLCELYSKLGMLCVVLRPTNIYGPHDKFDPEKSHVLPALIRKVVEKQNPIEIWGDGEDMRDLIYVDDMVNAITLATEKIEKFQPLNIGVGKVISVNQMLKLIKEYEKYDAPVQYLKDKPTMIPTREVDISKARNLIGFEPQIFPKVGIEKTITWYKDAK